MLKNPLVRRRLVQSIQVNNIVAVYLFEDGVYRDRIRFVNTYEEKWYDNYEDYEEDNPKGIDAIHEFIGNAGSDIDYICASKSKNFLGYEFNGNERDWTKDIKEKRGGKDEPKTIKTKST